MSGDLAGDANRMRHWHSLTREQQVQAIRDLARLGMSERTISAATDLTVEQVRRALGKSSPPGDSRV